MLIVQMPADKLKIGYMPDDELCCLSLTDNIINYIFSLDDLPKDINPAVNELCSSMSSNEKEILNSVLNKFCNNLNE
jgi:hypothetical protein